MLKISTLPSLKRVNLDKLTRYLGAIIRIYPENAELILEKVSLQFLNHNVKVFMEFCNACVTREKIYWYESMNNWKESLKLQENDGII